MSDDELFDVVDELDSVVGISPRNLVHRHGLRHRATHVLVYDEQGRLFVQQRSLTKDCSPGRWDSSAAGHVGAGETYDSAAVREVQEELGIVTLQPLTPLFKLPASPATGWEFVWVYRLTTAQTLTPDPGEIIEGRWCTMPELAEWLEREPTAFTNSFRTIWQKLHSD